MTLVVAGIRNGRIVAVCDSKLTWDNDEKRTRQELREARPKLLILRPDLIAGVAGSDFEGAARELIRSRDEPVEAVLTLAEELTAGSEPGSERSILVASDSPVRLWQIDDGAAEDRTAIGRAWAGDREAYERFRTLESPSFGDLGLSLQAPLQTLARMGGSNSTVGGITFRIDRCDHGFGFSATPMNQFEPIDGATMAMSKNGNVRLSFEVKASPLSVGVLTGLDPTRGALAIHLCGAGLGYLYPHDQPWQAETIAAATCGDLVTAAAERGQYLSLRPGCPAQAHASS